jgi:hypothetical protein
MVLAVLASATELGKSLFMRIAKDREQTGGGEFAFSLAELLISVAILGLVFGGSIRCYVASAEHAEWSAHALAAQSVASQGVEQARSAKWDPQAWPQLVGPGCPDELGITNYMQTAILDIPYRGNPFIVTNYVQITTVSTNPSIRQIRSDCVWNFAKRGMFTNSIITLRAADQ